MKVIKWKSVFRLLVDGMLCPWLLILFMLTAGIVTVSQPFVFKILYGYSMKDRPMLVEDGLKIAGGLSGAKAYTKINKTLVRGRIGKREIDHFEDIRNKIGMARGVALLSSISLLLLGVACAARWGFVFRMSLVWFISTGVVATIWATINFRHFFRSLHWWIFQDDSWILPDNCYSLMLYPYAVWKTVGAAMMVGVFLLLVLGCVLVRPKGGANAKQR